MVNQENKLVSENVVPDFIFSYILSNINNKKQIGQMRISDPTFLPLLAKNVFYHIKNKNTLKLLKWETWKLEPISFKHSKQFITYWNLQFSFT